MADVIGTIGCITGTIAFVAQVVTSWRKRRPKLQLFIPNSFTSDGVTTTDGQSVQKVILWALARISNVADHQTILYLETLEAQISTSGREWTTVYVMHNPKEQKRMFDMVPGIQHALGLNDIDFFNRYSNGTVSQASPLNFWLAITSIAGQPELEPADLFNARIRLDVGDHARRRYTIEAPLEHDPYGWKPGKPIPAPPRHTQVEGVQARRLLKDKG